MYNSISGNFYKNNVAFLAIACRSANDKLLALFFTYFSALRLYRKGFLEDIFTICDYKNYARTYMKLLIAEKSPIIRKRLNRLFSDLEYLMCVSFTEEIAHVQQKAIEEKPDMIVITIDFPSRIYLKMLTMLKNEIKESKIIVLTETTDSRYIGQFQNSGADRVFNKENDLNKFVAYLNIMDGVVKEQQLDEQFLINL